MKGKDGLKWPHTFDGRVWAKMFNKILVKNLNYQPIDEGFLIGWFCNAIMAGFDKARSFF